MPGSPWLIETRDPLEHARVRMETAEYLRMLIGALVIAGFRRCLDKTPAIYCTAFLNANAIRTLARRLMFKGFEIQGVPQASR